MSAVAVGGWPPAPSSTSSANALEAALEAARNELRGDPNILGVRLGYRFENGWITDEEVVVVEVKGGESRRSAVRKNIPEQFNGIGVEVRAASLLEGLRAEGRPCP
ncbi:MAG TPA: hypothetical protein VE262_03880 [Blastocatellia bacterium]|nr:hypothetical protein [Blastocatellia bacterium]